PDGCARRLDSATTCPCVSTGEHGLLPSIFFFNHTATPEIYTLSLHDALPISARIARDSVRSAHHVWPAASGGRRDSRSEEHTSELQSLAYVVCRLLLEKK